MGAAFITGLRKPLALLALAVAFLATDPFSRAAAAALGEVIENTAEIDYQIGGVTLSLTTPPAVFTVEARRTPSTIEFLRIAPFASDGTPTRLNGSDHATGTGASGNPTFSPIAGVTFAGGSAINFASPLNLVPAETYYSGEPIIIKVTDHGQNGDPTRIETVIATVRSLNGDRLTLRLYESGPDTGEFLAYFQSDGGAIDTGNAVLTIEHGFDLRATYVDPFDATEISVDIAGADPFGRVFDSTSGEFVNGVSITILDDATGQPAVVYGISGSAYPSTIISGSTVTDADGLVYTLAPGEFRFPILPPGRYRLVLTELGAYGAPSVVDAAALAALPNAPFTIGDASYLRVFEVLSSGGVSFDVPLDPYSELVVSKQASTDVASIGDFVRYEVTIENAGANRALAALRDELPPGFRYRQGSVRFNGVRAGSVDISADGAGLSFDSVIVEAGETVALSYVVEITSGAAQGDAVNRIAAVDGNGAPVSNIAEESIFIREDLLRSRLTIVGRVAADACNAYESWPRRVDDGVGVAGVRLYMETGAYVVTDENGLYHFEDVKPGTHVVQVDETTIPEGYEAVLCEANTRFAGTPTSQFVDAQGGAAWRSNFYLQRTDGAAASTKTDVATAVAAAEHEQFDVNWLNTQPPEAAFVYPTLAGTPKNRSVHVGVKHPNGQKVKLILNGAQVPTENFAGRDVSGNRRVAITRWRGVDILDGENHFVAVFGDADGNEIGRIDHHVWFITEMVRAEFKPEQSRLVADGRTPPVVAVRLTDGAGRPVHAGRIAAVHIDAPHRARDTRLVEDALPLTAPNASSAAAVASADGVALIELEPTTETGRARLVVELDGGRTQEITAYLKPELRDWIVVGVAEGSGSRLKGTSGGVPTDAELVGDGRVAVFAKGAVRGDWLITAAVDTDKGRGDEDDELFDAIDPDARYPLYGDRSDQRFEAQSRYPVYLKAEKDAFQALFGDYDTGLTKSKLGKYARRMSGIRTVYEGENFSFTGFAAETNMDFARDEIAADGTSGPFRLSASPLVHNSERIIVETRDRFRPDIVRLARPLTRYLDYDIDFQTGELVFRLPIPAAPDATSFNVIVAEYETSAPVERNLTYGGRAAHRFLDGRAEVGVTGIGEEGAAGGAIPSAELVAGDFTIDLTDTTKARFEYARSWRRSDGREENGDAVLAEIEHASGPLSTSAYYSEASEAFGLNQQSSAVTGARRYGAEASYRFHEFEMPNAGMRGQRFVDGKIYREENLTTGATRAVAELAVRQESNLTSGSAGLRAVTENPITGPRRQALLAVNSIKHNFRKLGLTLRGAHERPIASEGESTIYPERTLIGFDQKITDSVTLNVTHEIQNGKDAKNINTIVGVTAEPWSGARITVAGDRLTQDSGERIGATLGVDQQFRVSDRWTASVGVSRRQELSASGELRAVEDIISDSPDSPLEANAEFTSLYVGAGYRGDLSTGSARFEMRQSEIGDRYTGVLGAAREVGDALSFAGAARYEQNENVTDADSRRLDARFGGAWRPRGEGLIAFNRFDIKYDQIDGQLESWKAVNNLALNAMIDERWQVSLNHGFKYAVLDDGLDRFDGVTQLLGLESRFDITDWLDVGMRGMALYSHEARTLDYSYGPTIGLSPADNIWFTFGWNIAGFRDEDFLAAEYAERGPFITLRIKFDQHTARGLLDAISPRGSGEAPQ